MKSEGVYGIQGDIIPIGFAQDNLHKITPLQKAPLGAVYL